MGKLRDVVEWLNAMPGRKRGVAALLLGIGTSLRVLGLEPYAQGIEGFNTLLQGLTTMSDLAGLVVGAWALLHPLLVSHQQLQVQAVNVIGALQQATPPEDAAVRGLQHEAILCVQQAQRETMRAEGVPRG